MIEVMIIDANNSYDLFIYISIKAKRDKNYKFVLVLYNNYFFGDVC